MSAAQISKMKLTASRGSVCAACASWRMTKRRSATGSRFETQRCRQTVGCKFEAGALQCGCPFRYRCILRGLSTTRHVSRRSRSCKHSFRRPAFPDGQGRQAEPAAETNRVRKSVRISSVRKGVPFGGERARVWQRVIISTTPKWPFRFRARVRTAPEGPHRDLNTKLPIW